MLMIPKAVSAIQLRIILWQPSAALHTNLMLSARADWTILNPSPVIVIAAKKTNYRLKFRFKPKILFAVSRCLYYVLNDLTTVVIMLDLISKVLKEFCFYINSENSTGNNTEVNIQIQLYSKFEQLKVP